MKKKTIEDIKNYLLNNGCVLLSTEYKNNRTPIEYIGQCGHICKQTFGYLHWDLWNRPRNKFGVTELVMLNLFQHLFI